MKKLFLFFVLLSVATSTMCQIKIDNVGNVEICSNKPGQKLHVAGNTILAGTLTIESSTKLIINPNVGGFSEITTHLPFLNFKATAPVAAWATLNAKSFATQSDSTTKENILPLGNAISILKQINGYSYYFKADKSKTRQREYGVLAQEVEEILPGLVITSSDIKLVTYDGFIPFLIEGIKEQQTEIEVLQKIVFAQEVELAELRKEFKELQEIVSQYCGNPKSLQISTLTEEQPYPQKKAILYQNTPNPFSANTEIACNLSEATKHAVLYIYNIQGVELKSYPLTQMGLNTITINGSELSAGIYLYTLVVNNEIIDTKRMILTN